jgi:hypothetical protein
MFVPVSINLGKVPKIANGMHVLSGGVQIYVINGQKHRENGPAEINTRTGYQAWFNHGKKHRKDAPAVIDPSNGTLEYWENGKLLKRELINGRGTQGT